MWRGQGRGEDFLKDNFFKVCSIGYGKGREGAYTVTIRGNGR